MPRLSIMLLLLCCLACQQRFVSDAGSTAPQQVYQDTAFAQEYHEASPVGDDAAQNAVRSIAVDRRRDVWVATRAGIYRKKHGQSEWQQVLNEDDAGPAFSVVADSTSVWFSTWKGVFQHREGNTIPAAGIEPPIAALTLSNEGLYALGPHGVWLVSASGAQKLPYEIARSVRDAMVDQHGSLWVGTDVGLYRLNADSALHLYQPEHLASAYVRGISFDREGKLWAGGLGGVSILEGTRSVKVLRPQDGLPSAHVNCVALAPDGVTWVGTDYGVVRFDMQYNPSLRFSRRWLLSDRVNDIAFDDQGNAWIATDKGVSAIKRKQMTLSDKAAYFYRVLMQRHIRDPWIAGQCKLPVPGDTTVWLPDDDDNDGEYTGNYLAMECFRYAATGDPEAKANAGKAFGFLKLLGDVTGKKGFFARTIVPARWTEVDDANRTYSEKELADELIKEPRFKPVEQRWHRSADGKWLWKGDTSSDEMCGHMMGYFFYYELAADEHEKQAVRAQVTTIVDALMSNDYNLADIDGKPTRWGVWSPSRLNRDPEWMPDRSLNSMELLAFVKLAYHVSGDEKYEQAYRRLIDEEGYLKNMANIRNQNPGWFIYFDVMLAAYVYPILLKCEKDPKILSFYEQHMDAWIERYKKDENPLINFLYNYSRNKQLELDASVAFLKDTPLDLVDWPIDHSRREDVKLVRAPVLEDLQVATLTPASIRATIRWDRNPYTAVSGNPSIEREPVFWLLPYWMGRYLNMIAPEPVSAK